MYQPYKTEPHPLVRKMESVVDLAAEERDALRALPMIVRQLGPGQDIVRDGDVPSQCCVVLSGFAIRYRLSGEEARRQILAFHIPGEVPDLQSLWLHRMDHSLATLTSARVGFIQHDAIQDLMAGFPRLVGAFWRETLIDAAIFREWMVGLGQRRARSRIAHLLCEMYVRQDSIGMAEGSTVPFPITQNELGDALGLSSVHINRSLQELRLAGLISLESRQLTIHDWKGLAGVAGFDRTYLHLARKPAGPQTARLGIPAALHDPPRVD